MLGDVVDGQSHDPCDGDAEQGSQRACGPDLDGQSGVGREAEAGLRALHRSTPLEDRATWQPDLHASERAVALE
jgi:hypothetical protein